MSGVKKEFNINEFEDIFKSRNIPVPSNDKEFRKIITDVSYRFPLVFIKDKLIEILGKNEVEENYPNKIQKIDKFFECFEVVYNTKPEVKEEKNPVKNKTSTESSKYDIDKTIYTIDNIQNIVNEKKNSIIQTDKIRLHSGCINDKININKTHNLVVDDSRIKDSITSPCVFLMSFDKKEVAAVGRLQDIGGKKYFVADKENIKIPVFQKTTKFYMGMFGKENIYVNNLSVEFEPLKESEHTLCIDFGTSNTAVGSYGIIDPDGTEPEVVEFIDVTNNNTLVLTCPTVVYVKDCSDKNKIKYFFGYEAKKKEIDKEYTTDATVFYEIKRWITDGIDDEIRIVDENGVPAYVKRGDIVREYLYYIINRAEEYFACKFTLLHFTAPVKIKNSFLKELDRLLSDGGYKIAGISKEKGSNNVSIDSKEFVDEAAAIIYDYLLEDDNIEPNKKPISIVVLDCGGGTTDVATCTFEYINEENYFFKKIEIKTHFENGNPNFGGNNITYKIMQLIKIKIAIREGWIDKNEYENIFGMTEKDILEAVDREFPYFDTKDTVKPVLDSDKLKVYESFRELYKKCEYYLPTSFYPKNARDDEIMDSDRLKIKRNFYYLWQYAEKVKLAFYKENKVLLENKTLDLNNMKLTNKNLFIRNSQSGELESKEMQYDNISINEIRLLICGDIYLLLRQVLPDNPDDYDIYRLAGQSCKINLFTEMLKEFIPGKKLRSKMESQTIDEDKLKLRCLNGSIRFICNKIKGYYEISVESELPNQNYLVKTDKREEKFMYQKNGDELDINMSFLTEKQKESSFYVYYANDKSNCILEHHYKIPFPKSCKSVTIEEIIREFSASSCVGKKSLQALKVKIAEHPVQDAVRFIVALPSQDKYGFAAYMIIKYSEKSQNKYYMSNAKFFNYESDNKKFFDGSR